MGTPRAVAILGGILMFVACPARAEEPPPAAALAPASAESAQAAEKRVVLTVLGREYTADEIDPRRELEGVLYGALGERDNVPYSSDLLVERVFVPLMREHLVAQGLVATETEVERSVRSKRRVDRGINAEIREKSEEQIAKLEAARRAPEISEREMAMIDIGIAAQKRIVDRNRDVSLDGPATQTERQEARAEVEWWKFTKSIHDRFGGRVAIDAQLSQPVDAIRQWAEDCERQGLVVFADEVLRRLFYHPFVAERETIEAEAAARSWYQQPPWEVEELEPRDLVDPPEEPADAPAIP